ncbi:hypothetical protein cypCar_00017192 [Cyprinus carpio]|nr:hypothetical protein cypCar_00017192 [Cyprinus carpio]
MSHISAAALMLFGMGFLRVMFSTASIQTHPGQSVTMWCSHNIHVTGNLYWFKQSDGAVPITIVHMLYTESRQKVEPNYFTNFTKDHLVMAMDQFSKITTLTIKKVNISDSGFYFCGATDYPMKFGNGTRLEVKVSVPGAADPDRHVTQHHEEHHSLVYGTLQFPKHQKKNRRAARNTEDTDVVYSATR